MARQQERLSPREKKLLQLGALQDSQARGAQANATQMGSMMESMKGMYDMGMSERQFPLAQAATEAKIRDSDAGARFNDAQTADIPRQSEQRDRDIALRTGGLLFGNNPGGVVSTPGSINYMRGTGLVPGDPEQEALERAMATHRGQIQRELETADSTWFHTPENWQRAIEVGIPEEALLHAARGAQIEPGFGANLDISRNNFSNPILDFFKGNGVNPALPGQQPPARQLPQYKGYKPEDLYSTYNLY